MKGPSASGSTLLLILLSNFINFSSVEGRRLRKAASLNLNSDPALESFVCSFKPVDTNRCDRAENEDTLVAVQVIFRHGERTPLYEYVTDPYKTFDYGLGGLGQLTGNGKHWSYLLGKYIRCRYDGFLDSKYSISEIYCQSSETDRTMMTASAVLAGLYPPTEDDVNSHVDYPKLNWQPIPCTSVPPVLDNFINQAKICPMYVKENAEHISKLAANFDQATKQLFKSLSNITGNNVTNYVDVSQIFETIIIQHCQFNLPIPSWFTLLAPAMRPFYNADFYEIVANDKMKRFMSGPLLQRIIQNFDIVTGFGPPGNSTADLRREKMYLFSGHDTTISPILETLNIYNRQMPPPFNAVVFLELHKFENTLGRPSDYFIKIFYRKEHGKPAEELLIPGCSPCTYKAFKKVTQKFRLSDPEWEKECGVSVTSSPQTQSEDW